MTISSTTDGRNASARLANGMGVSESAMSLSSAADGVFPRIAYSRADRGLALPVIYFRLRDLM
ncbi:MAG: hypothetical protein E2O75_04015 [Chloroflexi bacterium]|nr:MAG: hypothetical protein E2O75_04015 [Chloroflexota bacterium]